jgi:tetratricopeptide (TPR) repeat protein
MARAKRSLGVVCLSEQQHDQAEPHFRAALREDPRDVKSLIGLGAVQWERNEKVEAFELYLRAAENEPGNVSCLLYLVNASYELNRLNDLENALRRFLTTERQNPHIQYCLAGCYFRQEKYARAEGVLERMLLVDPANADALELREEIRKRQNSDSSVVEEVPGLLANGTIRTFDAPPVREERSGPTIATRMRQLEEIKRRKDYASVIREADSMLKDPSASASQKALIGIIKGEALACTGEPTLADSEFARAMSDRVYAYRACTGRAALAASLEQWDEAEKLFHSALEAQENYDPAIAGLGIVAMSRDDHEKAWGYFSHALSLNCENMQALLGLTQLGYSMQRLPDTEKALIEYLDIHPVDLPIVYTYAGCLYAQGQKEAAAERCRTILIFDPTHELALELLTKIESEDTGVASAQAS